MVTAFAVVYFLVCVHWSSADNPGLALGHTKKPPRHSAQSSASPSLSSTPSPSSSSASTSRSPVQSVSFRVSNSPNGSSVSSSFTSSFRTPSSSLVPTSSVIMPSSPLSRLSSSSLSPLSTQPLMTPSLRGTMSTGLQFINASFTLETSYVLVTTDVATVPMNTAFPDDFGNASSVWPPATRPSVSYPSPIATSSLSGGPQIPKFSTRLASSPLMTRNVTVTTSNYYQTDVYDLSPTPIVSTTRLDGRSILIPTSFASSITDLNATFTTFLVSPSPSTHSLSTSARHSTNESIGVSTNTYSTPVPLTTVISSSVLITSIADSLQVPIMPSTTIEAFSSSVTPSPPTPVTEAAQTTSDPLEVYVPIICTIVLAGDCNHVMPERDRFIQSFVNSLSNQLTISPSRLSVSNLACGSVVVDFVLQDTPEGDFAEDLEGLMDKESSLPSFQMVFDDQNMTAVSFVFHNGPFAEATSTAPPVTTERPPVTSDDGGLLAFFNRQRLIFILVAAVIGSVIVLSLILLVHHAIRKACTPNKQSFDIQDEPCIKLTDFNMAHTSIPRPRSIYSSMGTNGKFYRYNYNEDAGNPPGSPSSSFIYANSDDIREQYYEVIDQGAQTMTDTCELRGIQEFDGSGGLRDWNLSLDDGGLPVNSIGGSGLLAIAESHHSSQPSTSSSETFRPSSSSAIANHPTYPPPAPPPPPPPPPLPTPVVPSAVSHQRPSCDASSEMTDSSGDTITLMKGGASRDSMMGIDNPAMTPEVDYDDPAPSTSSNSSESHRRSQYVVY